MSPNTTWFHQLSLVGIHRSAGPGVAVQTSGIFTSQTVLCKTRAAADSPQGFVFRELMWVLFYYWHLENCFSVLSFKISIEQQACFVQGLLLHSLGWQQSQCWQQKGQYFSLWPSLEHLRYFSIIILSKECVFS